LRADAGRGRCNLSSTILYIDASDARQRQEIWQSEIRFATLGFGKFDEKLADGVAVKVLDRLKG